MGDSWKCVYSLNSWVNFKLRFIYMYIAKHFIGVIIWVIIGGILLLEIIAGAVFFGRADNMTEAEDSTDYNSK